MTDEKIKERRRKNAAAMRRFTATPKGAAWLARGKARRKEQHFSAKHARKKRSEWFAFIAEIKSVPCMDCGGAFDPVCMDFDHRPGEIKLLAVSMGYRVAREIALAEIAKCDIVCANCHRLRTHRRRDHRKLCGPPVG